VRVALVEFDAANGGEGVVGSIAETLLQPGGESGLFAKYAPGGHPVVWPEGAARKVPAGSDFIFQVHYHKNPGPGTAARRERPRPGSSGGEPGRPRAQKMGLAL